MSSSATTVELSFSRLDGKLISSKKATYSRAKTATLPLSQLLQNSALETARALGADLGSIWRVSDDHRGGGAAAAFDAMPRVVDAAVTIPLALHAALRAICESGAALYSSDSAHDRRLDCPLLGLLPHRSRLIQR